MSAATSMEPQTYGLIVLKTTFGDLEVELFTKQCPKLTKNFVQLCLDGYYRDAIFNHVEKDFIAIGGIRTDELEDKIKELGTFKDEFHSRLRFTRRGLLASANTQKDSNGPGFIFTLGPCQELQNKHSIFGRLRGNTVYSLVELNECQVDSDLKPLSEKRIIEVEVIQNPFPELKPRSDIVALIKALNTVNDKQNKDSEPKFNLKSNKKLSFYQDEEEEDDESEKSNLDNQSYRNDLKISSLSQKPEQQIMVNKSKRPENDNSPDEESKRAKLDGSSQEQEENARQKRLREVREQIQNLKKQLECESATKIRTLSERRDFRKKSEYEQQLPDNRLAKVKSHKSRRARELETNLVVEDIKKKLKQQERKRSSSSSTKTWPNPGPSLKKANQLSFDDEDAELLDELNSLDDDSWLNHKFQSGN